MSIRDYTLATEVSDPDSNFSIAPSKITIANLDFSHVSYVAFDDGVNHYDGDIDHNVEVQQDVSALVSTNSFWGIANVLDSFGGFATSSNGYDGIFARLVRSGGAGIYTCALDEFDGGTRYSANSISLGSDVLHYMNCIRDENVGTYGTAYDSVYSDVSHTTLIDEVSIALHSSKKDYRYNYASQNWFTGSSGNHYNGFVQNTDIQEDQEVIEISSTAQKIVHSQVKPRNIVQNTHKHRVIKK